MDFEKQIKHPKWQKKRLEILERDEYTCQSCGSNSDTLHVHHYLYDKNTLLRDYNNDYLTTLCEDCHNYWHKINREIKEHLCVDSVRLDDLKSILEICSKLRPNTLILFKKIGIEIINSSL